MSAPMYVGSLVHEILVQYVLARIEPDKIQIQLCTIDGTAYLLGRNTYLRTKGTGPMSLAPQIEDLGFNSLKPRGKNVSNCGLGKDGMNLRHYDVVWK